LSTALVPEDSDAPLPESILKKFEGQKGMKTKLKMFYWKSDKFWVGKHVDHPEIDEHLAGHVLKILA
jgi:hypothetical protein